MYQIIAVHYKIIFLPAGFARSKLALKNGQLLEIASLWLRDEQRSLRVINLLYPYHDIGTRLASGISMRALAYA